MYVHSQVTGPWPSSGARVVRLPALYCRIPSSEVARRAIASRRPMSPRMAVLERGLGDDSEDNGPSAQQIAAGVISGASTGAAVAQSIGTTKGNIYGAITGGLLAAAPFAGPAAPFVAAAGVLVGLAAKMFAGCGQTCIQATKYADQAAGYAQKIHDLYFQQQVRTVASQQAAIQGIEQIMTWLQQMCSDPALGAAGQRCISERIVRGGTAPWCPTPDHRGCDWYTTLIDPIANDSGVVPDPAPPVSSSLLSAAGVNPSATVAGVPVQNLLLPAALLGAAFLLGR